MADNRSGSDHWVYFGDGNAAQILDSREYIKPSSGKKYVKFILLPSERIRQTFDIGNEQDSSGAIVREYSDFDVTWNERGIYRSRAWVYVDFNGGETPASRRFKELTTALKDSERLLRSSEAAKNRAYAELSTERQQKLQSIKLQTNIIREVAKARGRSDDDDGEMVQE